MYVILTVFLSILTALVYILYNISVHSIAVPDWISTIIGGAIGSIVAVLGAVLIQISSDSRKNMQQNKIQTSLLKKELYDNFIVCLYRIEHNTSEIPFFENVYDNLIINGLIKSNNKQFQEDISDLYFCIKRGHYGMKSFPKFYEEVFSIQQKKPRHYKDVFEIITSVGVEQIHEFSIMKQIIYIDHKYKLGLDIPVKDFQKILEYKPNLLRNIHEDTKYYITEIISRKLFEGDKVIHFAADLLVGDRT